MVLFALKLGDNRGGNILFDSKFATTSGFGGLNDIYFSSKQTYVSVYPYDR